MLVVAALAMVDITQGTAAVGAGEVWKALTGHADQADASVVIASRLPRMVAASSSAPRSAARAPRSRR